MDGWILRWGKPGLRFMNFKLSGGPEDPLSSVQLNGSNIYKTVLDTSWSFSKWKWMIITLWPSQKLEFLFIKCGLGAEITVIPYLKLLEPCEFCFHFLSYPVYVPWYVILHNQLPWCPLPLLNLTPLPGHIPLFSCLVRPWTSCTWLEALDDLVGLKCFTFKLMMSLKTAWQFFVSLVHSPFSSPEQLFHTSSLQTSSTFPQCQLMTFLTTFMAKTDSHERTYI